jgi:hypothetical protein
LGIFTCQDVKSQCIFVAKGLIMEVDKRFLAKELMNVTNIIYLQYGVHLKATLTFLEHLQILNSHYCYHKITQLSHYCYHKITQLDGKSHVPLLDHVLFEQ